jgi:probable DNA repair protein
MNGYRIAHLHTALAQGTLILTPNRRIAENIRRSWAAEHTGKIMTPPLVHALHDWLEQVASTSAALLPHKRLNTPETQWLWQRVTARLEHGLLMSDEAIARLLSSADDLLQRWCIHSRSLPGDPDSLLLKRAIAAYESELTRMRALDTLRIQRKLLALFAEKKITAPSAIILTGFDEIDPLHQRILDSCGASVQTITPPRIATQALRVACNDSEQEILAAALWAKQQIGEGKKRIGIIVPDIDARRAVIERLLLQVFEPQYVLPQTLRYSPPFSISAADALDAQPVVSCALGLLQLTQAGAVLKDYLFLLHSVFWSDFFTGQEERIAAEICLRNMQREEMTPVDLVDALPVDSTLRKCLQRVQMQRRDSGTTRYPSEWITLFQELLHTLGWPGQRQLDMIETRQVQQLQQVFDHCLGMDDICGKLHLNDMLGLLRSRCRDTPFYTKTQDTPLEVLGVLEGSSLNFDALWISGMGERQWPPLPKPHPLLPLALQLAEQMPHSSVSREQRYCEHLTLDMLNGAREIAVSFSTVVEEAHQNISGLFATLPEKHLAEIVPELANNTKVDIHPCPTLLANQASMEWLHDAQGPAFTDLKVRGGHAVLKAQAQNPFDAFAEYRLYAKPLPEPVPGLPARERGNLIHAALQGFWKQTTRQNNLLTLEHDALQQRILDCVKEALRQNSHPALVHDVFRRVEQAQLCKHLDRWLDLEKQRRPFSVLAIEKRTHHVLCGIDLSLTIDRIDQLEDGSLLLIDYKTTAAPLSPGLWTEERPAEPQLPLYSLATRSSAGIAFAQVNLQTMRWTGLGTINDTLLVKSKAQQTDEEWQAQQTAWQQALEQLMEEFKAGVARVEYRDGNIPDYSTHWQALNRWPEKEDMDGWLQTEYAKQNSGKMP